MKEAHFVDWEVVGEGNEKDEVIQRKPLPPSVRIKFKKLFMIKNDKI